MKILWLLSLLSLLTRSVVADCSVDDGQCQPGSGNCSAAVLAALPPSNDVAAAREILSYGKFCGLRNVCRPTDRPDPSDDQECEAGAFGCPPEPCDAVDTACAELGACTSQILIDNPGIEEPLGLPERCKCDVPFVAAQAIAAVTTPRTNLCDEAFYTAFIELFQHEAILLASSYCCDILKTPEGSDVPYCATDANDNGYREAYLAAGPFCVELLDQFASGGLDVCNTGDVNATNPVCRICPEGEEIGNPDAVLPIINQPCDVVDELGLAGLVPEEECSVIGSNQAIISTICGCMPASGPTDPPMDPPTDPPTDPQATDPPTDPLPTDPPMDPPTNPPTDPIPTEPTDPPTDPPTEPAPMDPPTNAPTTSGAYGDHKRAVPAVVAVGMVTALLGVPLV